MVSDHAQDYRPGKLHFLRGLSVSRRCTIPGTERSATITGRFDDITYCVRARSKICFNVDIIGGVEGRC